MIEQVVKSILEAEDMAVQEISKAESLVVKMLEEAHIDAEAMLSEATAVNKKLTMDSNLKANSSAIDKVNATLVSGKKAIDEDMAKYSDNVDKAVNVVMGVIL